MFQPRRTAALIFSTALLAMTKASPASGAEALIITPTTFDFGWCPDNAKISAQFTLKNAGVDMIPITSVQPTCGCTASQFTPGPLGSKDETKVMLTFNTRGYAGSGFNKSTQVKTDGSTEYSVRLTGFVVNPNAKVFPDQNGIASFEPGSKEKKKTVTIQNKSDEDVTLELVQGPALWASVKLAAETVKAGASVPLEVSVSGSLDEAKDTSVTYEAKGNAHSSRFTVAIRTGPPPPPTRAPAPPTPPKAPNIQGK